MPDRTPPSRTEAPPEPPPGSSDALVQLAEAEDTLRAIGAGEVDAFVISDTGAGEHVFTLSTADRPYRMFVENMRDGAATVSSSGLILFANRRLAELLSCSRETIVGAPLERFVAAGVPTALAEIRGQGVLGATMELDLVDGDGVAVPVLVGSSPLQVDGDDLTCLTFTDLRAQKQAMTALQASEARKSAMFECALDCVIVMDESGAVVEFNPAAEQVFGYSRDEVLGNQLADLIIPQPMRDRHRAGLAHYLVTGEASILGRRRELTAIRADGTEFPAELAVTRVEMPGPALFTAYLRDMSDQQRADVERQALEGRMHQSQRLESLGQLAGGVAHDFNNLLAVIMNYAAFVAEETADNPAAHADVEQIQHAAERAARLTQQLLIFGRRETVNPAILDLNAVVTEVHNLLSRSLGEDVQLAFHLADALPTIRADRGQLEQVLLNLAVNARDAMPTGGTLTVKTTPTELDDEYARWHPEVLPGSFAELSVSDTGVGMSAAVASHIFEPFFTTKPKGEGTGLGLATVYSIVAEAGGSIGVHSEEGIGTTFRLYFPAVDQPVATSPPPGEAKPRRGHGETILVVEDEPAMMDVTCRLLRRNGYGVLEALTGNDAIALALANDVQLLLTDSVMPTMSGPELAEHIQQLRPGLPVIFMSGYSQGVLGPKRLVPDDISLIQKPFNEKQLLERVNTVLTGEEN